MRAWKLFLLILTVVPLTGLAVDGDYSIATIPPSLLKNANAVIRKHETRFEIKGPREAILRQDYAITILNEAGDRWAEFSEYYTRQRNIVSLEGNLYDAFGRQIKKVRKKDFEDLSGVSDESLMEDDRIKRHQFAYKQYPFTIEYSVVIDYNSTFMFPVWVPRPGELISVQQSSISIGSRNDYPYRYKAFQYEGSPVLSKDKNMEWTTWSAKNQAALVKEPFSPRWHEISTVVLFGPDDFQIGEYKGNMSTWDGFGKFIDALKQGKDQLPEQTKQLVHGVADPLTSKRAKVTALYELMQKSTRYISIQLGIGGWQPFDASYVASKGYGDCKALTNYMYSLLKEIGITSYYTVIRAGRNESYITEEFPSQQFNHVILSVPLEQDTMWLECTSQTMPAGYLSYFTSDRPALLVNGDQSRLVRTPRYGLNDNTQQRSVRASLGKDAQLVVHSLAEYRGLQQDDLHGLVSHLSNEKVKEYLHRQMDLGTYEVSRFHYTEEKSSLPLMREELEITVNNYATITGKRLFILPNIMNRFSIKLANDPDRRFPVQLYDVYQETDSVVIDLPPGYQSEAIPADVELSTPFGKYHSSVKLKNNQLVYYRHLEHTGGRFPSSSYNQLVNFYESIYKADRQRVVLYKSE